MRQSTPQNKRKRINSQRMTQRTTNSKCPRKNRLRAFPIGQTQTPRLPPSHVSQRGPPSHQEEKSRSGPHRKTLNKPDLGFFAFAHAALLCRCGKFFAAVQPVSSKRSFSAIYPGGFQFGVTWNLSGACLLSKGEKLRPLGYSHGRQRPCTGPI